MTEHPRICVVGSANVDLTFRTPRLPQAGETLAGSDFHLGMGGKGANQAVAAARLGASVSLVARVGKDSFGQEAIRCYQTEGIDTSSVTVDSDSPTGIAAIMVDDHAENTIVVVAGANGRLAPADVRAAASTIERADVLLCQLETPIDATLEAFRLARSAGVRTVLTPAPATDLPKELLQQCDICVPNQTELQRLTGRTIETLDSIEAGAHSIRDSGTGTVVVTLGKRGAFVLHETGSFHVPALDVVAVDPTGAGDAFTAALAVHLAKGYTIHDAVRRASVVAAMTVTRIGTQTAFPSLPEVEALK